MAIRASSEIVIEAPPGVIMEALADMDAVPRWSPLHKRVEVVDRYPDGLPYHVKMTIRVSGIADTEMVEYHWGPDWMVWDAQKTARQHAQHGEYRLEREGDDKTRVRFSLTIELRAPLPRFWVRSAGNKILHAALEGLRRRVMGVVG